MQIPSTSPQPGTASSLSMAGRPVAGPSVVETRSSVMPAVQQPVEVEAVINRQNPANRPTLVDEEVRLYGPSSGFGTTAAAAPAPEAVVAEPLVADIIVDDQSQGRQQGGGEDDAQPAADAEESSGEAAPAARDAAATMARAADQARASDETRKPASTTDDTEQKVDATRSQRIDKVEQLQIRKLAARDREVRSHEAAHASIGGQYAGGASFTLKQGPNGVNYAIGGEVPIDVSAIPDDPDATIRKMQTVQRAALAPAEPSSADRAVAAQAARIAQQARSQIQSQQAAERAAQASNAREQRAVAAEKRAEISGRLTDFQNRFDFSSELGNAQRSRQISIVAESYGPLRPGTIGTLLDTVV